jgi:hypothetical protein
MDLHRELAQVQLVSEALPEHCSSHRQRLVWPALVSDLVSDLV